MQRTLFWQHGTLPIKIERFEFDLSTLPLNETQAELEAYIASKSDGESQTWGYFPEMQPDPADYPATSQLITDFNEQVINKYILLKAQDPQLAFVRRAIAEPQSNFGGVHVDACAGIGHTWPTNVDQSLEVWRMLFNLDTTARTLEYFPMTTADLAEKGLVVSKDHYEMLNLPEDLKHQTIDIPAREENAIYGLSFVSTWIPHAGRTTKEGHFLISYGSYIDTDVIKQVFQK